MDGTGKPALEPMELNGMSLSRFSTQLATVNLGTWGTLAIG